jgi:hypothetical protein
LSRPAGPRTCIASLIRCVVACSSRSRSAGASESASIGRTESTSRDASPSPRRRVAAGCSPARRTASAARCSVSATAKAASSSAHGESELPSGGSTAQCDAVACCALACSLAYLLCIDLCIALCIALCIRLFIVHCAHQPQQQCVWAYRRNENIHPILVPLEGAQGESELSSCGTTMRRYLACCAGGTRILFDWGPSWSAPRVL